MTKPILAAGLLLLTLPAIAQTKPLTPPDVLGAAKTIQFTLIDVSRGMAKEKSTVMLAQPNKAYASDTDAQTKAIKIIYASDGKTQTEYRASSNQYTKSPAPAQLKEIDSRAFALRVYADVAVPENFAKFRHRANDLPGTYRRLLGSQGGGIAEEVLAVNPATGLPKSVTVLVSSGRQLGKPFFQVNFTDWKLNAPVDNTKFAYTPPADAKLYTPPMLLADGTAAPDFTVQDKDGKPVKLSDYKGKTVVLDFWATWCGPCQSSFPNTAAVAKKFAARNVVVLAVNVWDSKSAFDGWLPQHPEYAPLNFAIDPNPDQSRSVASALYGVSGIPTQYVIGPDGNIKKSIVGYEPGDTQLEDALK